MGKEFLAAAAVVALAYGLGTSGVMGPWMARLVEAVIGG